MKQENKSVLDMWENYMKFIGDDISKADKKFTSWHFCDNETSANNLSKLVKDGIKRATTGLYYFHEVENEALPKAGDFSIVTDWEGKAQCIIETKKVTILPFKEVTEEFARLEGEGDKSLKYWREVHTNFFTRELKERKKEFNDDMLVVCEEFEIVFK